MLREANLGRNVVAVSSGSVAHKLISGRWQPPYEGWLKVIMEHTVHFGRVEL